MIHQYRRLVNSGYRERYILGKECKRICALPRYVEGSTELLLERRVRFIDGASFYFTYKEIFEEKVYDFSTDVDQPFIIDAGANIGLSIIRFKQLYPLAHIFAFEPDKLVFKTLTENIDAWSLEDVTLVNKALWNEDTRLQFLGEGADAGRVPTLSDSGNLVEVQATSLRPYIDGRQVDFLKIDIEGAELTVLKDCADLLRNVARMFVEYHSFTQQE